MPMPGAGDPYFYEWYIGLENVIKMLNPDSGIKHVIFQHDEYDTIDDVVVEYANGNAQVCYQVKHNIGTATTVNLTFGSMLKREEKKSVCLKLWFRVGKKLRPHLQQQSPLCFLPIVECLTAVQDVT